MFARKSREAAPASAEMALMVQTMDGKTLCAFPAETVTNLRRMLTNLMYQTALPKSMACVAALREEGVTYTALAMAATLASDLAASRVCLVELNWWNPSLHRYIAGQPPMPAAKGRRAKNQSSTPELPPTDDQGIGAVLRGVTSLEDAVVRTSLPNFSLLPAGNLLLRDRSAMARSDQLKQHIATLNEQFDHIILDVPAVAATSDAVALASLSEAVCMVVHQGVTPVNTVKLALDEVKHLQVLGVIMNQVQIHTPRWLLNMIPQE
ncbi:MAG: chromosome partitioning protein [Chloroflexaceae bacterium]|jgi:Mrp family chromosome partitioning ATPase|nr:chromosome partitioning protein [Chloroflexaceae bacterium]